MTTKAINQGSVEPQADVETYTDGAIDLREYLKVLRKHRWAIGFTTAVFTCFAGLFAMNITPIYRATATLSIETQQALPMNLDNIIGIDTNNTQYFQTQFEALRSKNLAQRVVSEMGLYEHPELRTPESEIESNSLFTISDSKNSSPLQIDPAEIEKRKVIEQFIERTSISPVKNTKMVRISFNSTDPIFAATVANKIADTYIVSYADSRAEMGEKANILLNNRLRELQVELEQSQKNLLDYREANGLIDIQGDSNRLSEQEIGIITSKLLDVESEAAYAKILFEEVSKTKNQGIDALLGLPSIDSNEMVRLHKLALQETQLVLDELKNRYGDKHPKVIDANSRQRTALDNLYSQINNIVDSIEKDYLLSRQTAESLREKLDDGKRQLQQSDRSNLDLLHLEREVQLNQELFDTLYTRSREVDEAENINASNAQIAEYAEAPLRAISPKVKLITLLAMLLSAAACMLIAILRESINNVINSTEDVELNLGTRMLGILPLATAKTRKKARTNALIPGALGSEAHAFEESVRTIRTSICLDDLEQSNQVIMVTSALPSEGKSTLASHLAYSLSGIENVLLIECDLRRPSLHRAFQFPNNCGLTQLLTGEAQFSMCIKPGAIGNLDVIPAGSIPNLPLDLLTSRRFTRLIELMRQRYDRIIIDSAPVQAVSDALVLGKIADSVLYTVKANSTDINVAARGVSRLQDADINVTGVVVSQVNLKKESYHGEQNYQGYYDYYGYSDVEKSTLSSKHATMRTDKAA